MANADGLVEKARDFAKNVEQVEQQFSEVSLGM